LKIKISDIKLDDKNFNKHTPYGMGLLEKSIDDVGIIETYTVSKDYKTITGNARHEVISRKFDGVEPLVIDTDGKQPIIIRRTDIESGTAQFHKAAILANTVAKKNINLDLDLIQEVAVEEYQIDIEELGVDVINNNFSDTNSEIDVDSMEDEMVMKLKYKEEDYWQVKDQLSKIAQTPEQAVWKLLGNE